MPTKVHYYPLGGGLDITTPAVTVKPGRALTMRNFEPWYNGGYRRIQGFERWDGRPRPSDATFLGFDIDTIAGLSVGDTVTGDTSGATGEVVGIDGLTIGVTKVVGTFVNGEDLNTSTYTITSSPVLFGAPTISLTEDWLLVAENNYRADILVVPGTGSPGGAWRRRATTYAVRDNVGVTAGILYQSSSSGWTTTGITMGDYLFFDTGLAAGPFEEGDTVTGTISGATATVHRVILQEGSWSGDAKGYLVLTGVTGTFVNNDPLEVSATPYALSTGANVTFAFSAGGRYEFINHNFFGGSGTYRTYGCNGLDPAFEIDENNIVSPILFPETALTGQPVNNIPFLIEEHRNYLFIAIPGGLFQHSVIGEPLQFNGFLGAAEFGIGDEVTGLNSVVGGVLAIHSEREVRGLFGTTILDWEMKLLAEQTGGKLYTCQKVDTVYSLDDLGITSLARSETFGDFVGATVSQLVQPLVTDLRVSVTASTIVRESNQYRVYFNDPVNSALVMYIPAAGSINRTLGLQTREGVEFGYLSYPFPVEKIYNTDDETGKERTYFTSTDGFVYEDQIGRNFDGDAIVAYVRLVFNHVGSPSYRKRFRRVEIGVNTTNVIDVKFVTSLTYDDVENQIGITDTEVQGLGGYWDIDSWDAFVWDGRAVSTGKADITGTGENISFLIYNETAKAEAWIMHGLTLQYDLRRLQR